MSFWTSIPFITLCDSDNIVCEGDHVLINMNEYGIHANVRGVVLGLSERYCWLRFYKDDAELLGIDREWKYVMHEFILSVLQGIAPFLPHQKES